MMIRGCTALEPDQVSVLHISSQSIGMSVPCVIFYLGQELSVKPFSLLSTNPR